MKFVKKSVVRNQLSTISSLIVVIAVSLVGVRLLENSHAQSTYVSAYAANGQRTGTATLVDGGSNESGQAVQFGTASSSGGGGGNQGGCSLSGIVAPCVGSTTTAATGWGNPIFNDTFANDNNTLNTKLWTPYWYSNGASQNPNCTSTQSSNVSVSGGTLNLKLTSGNTCGFVNTDPDDGVSGHTGFQVTPDNGNVYVEFKAYLPPASSTNAETANWPALWLAGEGCWPSTGEIDVLEGLGGYDSIHLQYGPASADCDDNESGGTDGTATNVQSGIHTFGILWTTSGITGYYDGAEIWSTTYGSTAIQGYATAPEFLIMENSGGAYGGPSVVPSTMNVYYARVWQQ